MLPQNSPQKPPAATDLFAANKAINARQMAPAVGFPTVPSYRPSGKTGGLAFPLLLLSLVLVPAIGALLYDRLWHFGGLMIFSQLALGALVGALLFPSVHLGKVRNPVLAAGVGALIGAATFSGAMALEAWRFRPQYLASESAYIAQKYGVSPQKARAAAEGFYTPTNTVKFYWLDRAQAGVTMTSSRSNSRSQVSGTGFWALEIMEGLLASILAAVVAHQMAARRFSEEFNRWFIVKKFGIIHPLHVAPLLEAAQAGDWAKVGQFTPARSEQKQNGAQMTAAYLPEKAGGIVTVKASTGTSKGVQPIFEQEVSNAQMKALWPAFPVVNAQDSPFSS